MVADRLRKPGAEDTCVEIPHSANADSKEIYDSGRRTLTSCRGEKSSFRTTRELFESLLGIIQRFSGLAETEARLLSYAVLAS